MIIYAIVKYLLYSLWCYVGLRLLANRIAPGGAFAFGAIRWLLGLVLGVIVFMAIGSVNYSSLVAGRFCVGRCLC